MQLRAATRLLIVEDNPGDARLLQDMLLSGKEAPTAVHLVAYMREAEVILATTAVDLILLDLNLPDAQGLEAVYRAQAIARRVPLVVLSGVDDDAVAIQALQHGAQDYLIKGQIDQHGLARALRYALERKNLDEALFAETERALVTLAAIGDAVVCVDTEGVITFINRVAERMVGWPVQEAAGNRLSDILHLIDGVGLEPAIDLNEFSIQPPGFVRQAANYVLINRSKVSVPVEFCISPIHDRDLRFVGAVIVLHDVSEARELAHQMARSAQHDFLTGLPNRMLLNDRITQAIAAASRRQTRIAVLFIDLDGFKHVNDSFGHAVGDLLLQSVGRRLVECVRGSDTVSRQGGDEFVVLLSDLEQAEDAADVAARILDSICSAHHIESHDVCVSASIGVSLYPGHGADAESLIRKADTAMYQAKSSGRGTCRFIESPINVGVEKKLGVEAAMSDGLGQDEFLSPYQPPVNVRTGSIAGADALLR